MSCLNKDADVRMYYHPDKFPDDSEKEREGDGERKKKSLIKFAAVLQSSMVSS